MELQTAAAQLRHAFVMLVFRILHQKLALAVIVRKLFFNLLAARQIRIFQVHVRARLVDQVDGLVGQEAVGDIPLAEQHGLTAHLVRDRHVVEVLVIMADALEDLHAVVERRLRDRYGLEATLKRGVLFDVLAVFGERRRADDLNLSAREGGLEDVGGVHAALGVARADDVVHLVDDEDDVADLTDVVDESLHAALELAAKLRAGHERRQVEEINLLVAQLIGHVARRDALRQPLGDGRLADARFADEAGVVLLPAVEDLDDALQLLGAADHAVKLAVAGARGEVDAVAVKELVLAGLLLAVTGGGRLLRRAGLAALVVHGLHAAVAEQPVQKREGRGLAVVLLVAVRIAAGEIGQLLGVAEHLHHVSGDALQIVVAEAHFLDHVIHGLDVQLARALETKSLVARFVVFNSGNKDDRHVFLTAGTQSRLHSCSPVKFNAVGSRSIILI